MSKSVDVILGAVKAAGEAALRLHEENKALAAQLAEANVANGRMRADILEVKEKLAAAERERDRHSPAGGWGRECARAAGVIGRGTAADREGNQMSDIVERLRVLLRCRCEPDAACCETCSAVDAVEDEIERLRELLQRWREQWGDGCRPEGDLIDETDAALERTP